MSYYSFEILIEKKPEDEGCHAYSPTPPGCFGAGFVEKLSATPRSPSNPTTVQQPPKRNAATDAQIIAES